MIRISALYNKRRLPLDVQVYETVHLVKDKVVDLFRIDTKSSSEKKYIVLSYHGAELQDDWVLSEIGVNAGSTLKCSLREEVTPKLFVRCSFNDEVIEIIENLDFASSMVAELRLWITRKIGLPVTVYRILTSSGQEMFDSNLLSQYGIEVGTTLQMETIDGWNEFLKSAIIGHTQQVFRNLNQTDEVICKFQMRVALFVAAHYGHMDLATAMLKNGLRADEKVGDHPSKEWCRSSHIEAYKTPVHEAAEHGQLSILRIFVFNNICVVHSKDGMGLTALNVALRKQQKEVALYLLTKQWANVQFSAMCLPLTVYSAIRRWCDKAKDKVLLVHGLEKSSMKYRKSTHLPGALCGQGVHVDGYTESLMNSCPKSRTLDSLKAKNLELARRGTQLSLTDNQQRSTVERLPRLCGTKTPSVVSRYRNKYLSKTKEQHSNVDPLPRPRSRSVADTSVVLPDIPFNQHKSRRASSDAETFREGRDTESYVDFTRSERGNTAYIRTAGGTGSGAGRFSQGKDVASISDQKSNASMKSDKPTGTERREIERKRRNRAASLDCSIPLLPTSGERVWERPFFYSSSDKSIPRSTIDLYEGMTGSTTWERAINAITVTSSFKDKSWLYRVRMAMSLSETQVKKLGSNPEEDRVENSKRPGMGKARVGSESRQGTNSAISIRRTQSVNS
ncbi:protein ANKUB1-like [Patiria miniata]|uniref:Ubiquitin-like domain-containing protein n=1 Tax=Patiria miniata TaxID=46514 RepID=A0A914A428_PATMI|nr:protein ANKUB1-like [Patiria miniata]